MSEGEQKTDYQRGYIDGLKGEIPERFRDAETGEVSTDAIREAIMQRGMWHLLRNFDLPRPDRVLEDLRELNRRIDRAEARSREIEEKARSAFASGLRDMLKEKEAQVRARFNALLPSTTAGTPLTPEQAEWVWKHLWDGTPLPPPPETAPAGPKEGEAK